MRTRERSKIAGEWGRGGTAREEMQHKSLNTALQTEKVISQPKIHEFTPGNFEGPDFPRCRAPLMLTEVKQS